METHDQFIRLYACVSLYFISNILLITLFTSSQGQSQWPRGLRRSSAAARLLRSWVRIPPGAWMFVCCDCCVLSGKRSLRRADHSSRGVLSNVMRRCVWSRNFVNEEALAHWGAVAPKTNKQTSSQNPTCDKTHHVIGDEFFVLNVLTVSAIKMNNNSGDFFQGKKNCCLWGEK